MSNLSEDVIYHIDYNESTELRSRIFGHNGVIIPFKEGMIAKRCNKLQELNVYQSLTNITRLFSSDIVPTIEGIANTEEEDLSLTNSPREVHLKMRRDISCPDLSSTTYLLMHDIAEGFIKPAVLDVKLGIRTWALGADSTKRERMKEKCRSATTSSLKFRVRAAIWYSQNPNSWSISKSINYVERTWGNTCSEKELIDFFNDFFHFPVVIPQFISKLEGIRDAALIMRDKYDARLFSSSVLFAYDETDPSKIECRLLDFAKCYLGIKKSALEYNETVDDCEDALIPALENLISLLKSILLDC